MSDSDSDSDLGLEKQLKFTLPLNNHYCNSCSHLGSNSDSESDTVDSELESDDLVRLTCMVCNHTKNEENILPCDSCDAGVCIKCVYKGYYLESPYQTDEVGTCYRCLSRGCGPHAIFFSSYEKLYRICKSIDEKSKEKDTYIKQLEEDNKLLKAMIDFQPGGEGYLAARDHFKQLQNNDKID